MDFELEDDEFRIARRAQFARQRRMVWLLSLGGLIPFVACALVLLVLGITNPVADPAVVIFRNYSVVILSFLGGIRWGHAILHSQDETSIIQLGSVPASIVPALVAWATMFLPSAPALALLLLAYCLQGVWDSFSAHLDVLPKWFGTVRIVLTACVAVSHIVVFLLLA